MQPARKLDTFESYESFRYREALKQREEDLKKEAEKKSRNAQAKRVSRFVKNLSFCMLVFASLAVMIFRYSALYEMQYQVNGIKSDIKQIGMEIEELNTTLDSTISLDNVERVAMTELNMQYPKPEQIVYVKKNWNYALDKQSQNKYLVKDESSQEENLSGKVYDYILQFAFGGSHTSGK